MARILDIEMGWKHPCGQRNGGEIFLGKLHHSGPCNTIRVDIFATLDKIYGASVYGSGKSSVGKLFALSFLWNIKNTPLLLQEI